MTVSYFLGKKKLIPDVETRKPRSRRLNEIKAEGFFSLMYQSFSI